MVMVSKQDGNLRLCGDYRRLNAMTEADPYTMPRVEELLNGVGRAFYPFKGAVATQANVNFFY